MRNGEAATDGSDIKAVSAATYAATADHFDDPALSFWDRFGRQTVARIGLSPGDRVLDACCGTGASALPAAHVVGAAGKVLGVDLAEPALALARAKAHAQGLTNVEFQAVDVEHTALPSESFDAVVCVFGVFFLPDMAAAVAEMWRLVRPAGVLAITVWGPEFLEPATTAFWAAVGVERPDLVGGFHPWTRVTDPAAVSQLFHHGGATTPIVEAEPGTHPLADPEDWWTVVLGTGYRATVQQLRNACGRPASDGYVSTRCASCRRTSSTRRPASPAATSGTKHRAAPLWRCRTGRAGARGRDVPIRNSLAVVANENPTRTETTHAKPRSSAPLHDEGSYNVGRRHVKFF